MSYAFLITFDLNYILIKLRFYENNFCYFNTQFLQNK